MAPALALVKGTDTMSFPRLAALALLACAPSFAQARHSVLFTGRFGFTSLDAPNERAGGSITQLREFDVSVVTPGAGAFARSWLPTTAHSAMWGDAHNDGNYVRFFGWKTYFERFNFAGPFVKHADRNKHDPRLFFWTVRDDAVNKPFFVFTSNGTQAVQIQKGDFFRFGRNGNVEYFITQALIDKARGRDRLMRAEQPGAGCICQDAQGNLYYSPAERGHWVHGNYGVSQPVFANDGSIVMIDAADITYDASGNVLDVAADKAHILFEEVMAGPNGQPSVRTMNTNAGANNYNGNRIASSTKMVGLALDPNGGTITASLPYGNNVYPTVPNFLWCWDSGDYAATIWSSANHPVNQLPGSIAVINGVKMGEDTPSVPGTGAWLGVLLDIPNFQPTLMGIAITDAVPFPSFVADAPNDGAIQMADASIAIDFFTSPSTPVFAVLGLGPVGNGRFQASTDVTGLVGNEGFRSLYVTGSPEFFPVGITNASGYVTLTLPNVWNPALVGVNLVWHGFKIGSGSLGVALSNPVLQQFR
jgi:hypothetical protein